MASETLLHPDDLLRLTLLEDVALSPDITLVAATIRTAAPDLNRYRSAIELFPGQASPHPGYDEVSG